MFFEHRANHIGINGHYKVNSYSWRKKANDALVRYSNNQCVHLNNNNNNSNSSNRISTVWYGSNLRGNQQMLRSLCTLQYQQKIQTHNVHIHNTFYAKMTAVLISREEMNKPRFFLKICQTACKQ